MSSSVILKSNDEDKTRNWANNIIEKSAGGRVDEPESKVNWTLIIGIIILVIAAIIYFMYSGEAVVDADTIAEITDSVPLLIPVVTAPALTALVNPVNTEATV